MPLVNQSGSLGTILLLGSEPVVREVIREALEQSGYVVLPADDVGKAMDFLADCPVDLLVTHPYIDNVPGHQAAQYLRARNPRMAVLVIAGLPDDDRLTYREELARFEIFPEPFSTAQLVKKVQDVLSSAPANGMGRSAQSAD